MSDLPEDSEKQNADAIATDVDLKMDDVQAATEERADATEESPAVYKVGPGRPPLHSRFRKGERSGNPDGRPAKVRPSLSSRQRLQDVARALAQPLKINGELKPFSAVNLELMKQSAIKGNGVSQRYLDKLDRTNRQEIMLQEAEIAREIATAYRNLASGEAPAKWDIRTLNELAERLEQLYLDPNHDPRRTRTKDNARFRRANVSRLLQLKAKLKEEETWPPPGTPDLSDEEIAQLYEER